LRGGRDLTQRLAEVLKVPYTEAETYKRQFGLTGDVGNVLFEALKPLLREIRQTLKGHLAAGGQAVTRVLLAGGGGMLGGLDRVLENEIGIPVERYGIDLGTAAAVERSGRNAEFALPYASACQETLQRRRRIDLRRGDLTYKRDYKFLKRRMGMAAVFVLAVLFSWIFSSYAQYRVLAGANEALANELKETTQRMFGKPVFDRKEIESAIEGQKVDKLPIPQKDVFDIIVELSRRIPFSVVHDIERLDIKSKKVVVRGVIGGSLVSEDGTPVEERDAGLPDAGSDLSPIDLIKQKLEGFDECFTAIHVGKVTVVGDRRRYQMDIDSKCP
jgi:hypothetical protein